MQTTTYYRGLGLQAQTQPEPPAGGFFIDMASTPTERVLRIASGENSLNPGLINLDVVAKTEFTPGEAARIERLSNLKTNSLDRIALAIIKQVAKLGLPLTTAEEIMIALKNREPGF